jgi:hypothetical protein
VPALRLPELAENKMLVIAEVERHNPTVRVTRPDPFWSAAVSIKQVLNVEPA